MTNYATDCPLGAASTNEQRDYGDEDPQTPNYAHAVECAQPDPAYKGAPVADFDYAAERAHMSRVRALELAISAHGKRADDDKTVIRSARAYLAFLEG